MRLATLAADEAGAPPTADNLLSLLSIAVVACVSVDMVHEAIGHGTASLLTGNRILSISTVALQSAEPSRFVSAAGTAANCIVGALAFLLLRRWRNLTAPAYFLWLFGAFNLFNSWYLVASAAMNNGDWANVIAGLSPAWPWRVLLGLGGAALYFLFVRWTAGVLAPLASREGRSRDVWRLVLPAYLASGAVMTIASVFNPIGPSLILGSGVGASFGLNFGFLFVPSMVAAHPGGAAATRRALPFSPFWILLAIVSGGIFIAILGPGLRFAK
jgi:hypothetical protein